MRFLNEEKKQLGTLRCVLKGAHSSRCGKQKHPLPSVDNTKAFLSVIVPKQLGFLSAFCLLHSRSNSYYAISVSIFIVACFMSDSHLNCLGIDLCILCFAFWVTQGAISTSHTLCIIFHLSFVHS